jgi:hypothetical protein
MELPQIVASIIFLGSIVLVITGWIDSLIALWNHRDDPPGVMIVQAFSSLTECHLDLLASDYSGYFESPNTRFWPLWS